MIPNEILQLIQILGLFGFVVLMMVLIAWMISNAVTRRMNSDTTKGETVTGFAIDFNAERKVWQERHDKLQSEFTEFRIDQARKDGGLEQLEKILKQERDERRVERDGFGEQLRKLDGRVHELEKHNQQGLDRIRELEDEQSKLAKQVAERDTRIRILEEQKTELTTHLEQERNRAETLSGLVDRLQAVPTTQNTQPIPNMGEAVEDTFVPDTENAVSTAEEQTS